MVVVDGSKWRLTVVDLGLVVMVYGVVVDGWLTMVEGGGTWRESCRSCRAARTQWLQNR